MKHFCTLITALDQTTKTTEKIAALVDYFEHANDQDRLWCLALFTRRRPKRAIKTTDLRAWAARRANIPEWLLEDSYEIVGDLAETLALVLPPPETVSDRSLTDWIHWLIKLGMAPDAEKQTAILGAWNEIHPDQRFVFNKLITGGFRIGVQEKIVTRALAQVLNRDPAELTHRLMGNWSPQTHSWADVFHSQNAAAEESRPYPFYLCHGRDDTDLGPIEDWQIEWKWDGIRAQIIKRKDSVFIWSRGNELITHQFPDLENAASGLPDGTVLDGEILVMDGDRPEPFAKLQKRLGRKSPSPKMMANYPAGFMAYDLLEYGKTDYRSQPTTQRRQTLSTLIPSHSILKLSPTCRPADWASADQLRQSAPQHHAEGLMLKRKTAVYTVGRKRGDWWKWKRDPMTIDAVMIYAQAGHGRRANLFTDYTFALWNGNDLVPITKAYSGLTDAEFRQITQWVRKNTLQRFGPVRQVPPEHVFEIAFEGINESTRHKSGLALRFPRMVRWRTDKSADQANTVQDIREFLNQTPSSLEPTDTGV